MGQEARPEAVLDARRLVRRPSWTPGGTSGGLSRTPGSPSGGRLGRQEARPQAVLGGRTPECRFDCSFGAKCKVLRRRQGWGSESGAQRPQADRKADAKHHCVIFEFGLVKSQHCQKQFKHYPNLFGEHLGKSLTFTRKLANSCQFGEHLGT